MINIFNLFLLLLALWSSVVYTLFGFDYVYLVLGVVPALLISVACFNLRIINKKSELLYLSWGFYTYFVKLYCSNFFKQILLQIMMVATPSIIDPKVIKTVLKSSEDKKHAFLFESTIDFMAGYSVLEVHTDYILVGAINSEYAARFSSKAIFKKVNNINDDSLV